MSVKYKGPEDIPRAFIKIDLSRMFRNGTEHRFLERRN